MADTDAGAVRALPTPNRGAAGLDRSPGYDRTPPHNLEAEECVLGSMLLSKNAIADVTELLRPEDFYRGAHRTVFEAVRDLYDRGEPVDTVTLADELEHRGRLDDVGGSAALADIVSRVPTAANALYYGRIVADQALRRRLIDAGTVIARLGYEAGEDPTTAVDAAEAALYQVAHRSYGGEFIPMRDLLKASFDLIERLHESDASLTGLPTGFTDFDEVTSGLQPSNLVIVAARPSIGKSTFVTNVATHVAVEAREPVVMFSLEMSQMELAQRILSSEARVDSDRLRTGRLQENDWPKLSQAIGRLAEANLFIDDTPGINLMEIRSKCRRLKQRHGLSLVIVDYLQLMHSHRRVENRVQEVSELSRGLKILAKELDIPVIALSQLSRRPEDRTDRRPQLADLRESGCVTGDTLIALASGETVPIAALVGSQPEVVTLAGWRVSTEQAVKVWRTGRRPIFRLVTRTGRVVRATGNHPLRKLDGWHSLESLQVGDRVAIPRAYPRMREVGITQRAMARMRGTASGGTGHFSSAPSRAVLEDSAAVLDAPELKELAAAEIYWDTVVSIEPDGVEDVFDMTVPGTHNFVGNGIYLHNSIEQDSDLVAFLYRDDYYNPDSEAKGEAELILAKHRNGPLRTVRLSFIGHQARFANMARGAPPGGRPL